jgi:hypothetical protein
LPLLAGEYNVTIYAFQTDSIAPFRMDLSHHFLEVGINIVAGTLKEAGIYLAIRVD